MAEERDNAVLRLLRDMRAEVAVLRQDVLASRQEMIARFSKLDRGFGELREATVNATGWAGFAKVAADHNGKTLDAKRLELDEMRARLAALENRA